MNELDLQKQIRNSLKVIGHDCWKVDTGPVKRASHKQMNLEKGFPDLFGFRKEDKRIFFIEIKMPKGKLKQEQKEFLLDKNRKGCLNGVARNLVEAIEIIQGTRTIENELEEEK
ncbi:MULTISPECIES: VRR-NUC domain-containing protein [unclassified Enterococcus]|uniref:VRR-NUC domain-containing protein n=1 Tax=unclassified Enterococcus TaxID=2608891 RepID=UPI00259B21C2|nr:MULTISPECIES: VRR-NUC domain-containing protein [unclassified Enterococcus]MDO0919869.1 VRR-NUC domain-containing protein [Enterococcus sp. B1E2]WIV14330.1 VRR-NUC domain-containing protein [Enterococcus sp. FZMF]